MKRFVSYLYSTYNNQKIHNAGFARVELRTGRNRIDIHLRENGYSGKVGTVYLFIRNQKIIQGITIGNITFHGSQADFRYEQTEENVGQTPWQITQMHGILIIIDDQVVFLSQWDEEPIDTSKFKVWDGDSNQAQKGLDHGIQVRPDSNQPGQEMQENTRNSRQNQEIWENAGNNQLNQGMQENKKSDQSGQEMQNNIQSRQSGQGMQENTKNNQRNREMQENTKNNQQNREMQENTKNNQRNREMQENTKNNQRNQEMQENTKNNQRNLGMQENAKNNQLGQEIQDGTRTNQSGQGHMQNDMTDNQYEQNAPNSIGYGQSEKNAGSHMDHTATRNGVDLVSENKDNIKNIPDTAMSAGAVTGQPAVHTGQGIENTGRSAVPADQTMNGTEHKQMEQNPLTADLVDSDSRLSAVSDIRTAELQPQVQPDNLKWDQTWRYMLRTYPVIHSFGDQSNVLCVRIEIKDVRLLPEKYWSMINNSFLLHGFFNYRYLIFGRMEQSWFVGIPGIYQNQEHVMASIFGFPDFLPQEKENERGEQPGYWYRILEI